MIYRSRLKFQKIKEFLLNFSELAAENLFFTALVLILVSVVFGLAVFYKYSVLPQTFGPEPGEEVIKFQENTYQKILDEWQSRGERFEAAKTKTYADPFKELTEE